MDDELKSVVDFICDDFTAVSSENRVGMTTTSWIVFEDYLVLGPVYPSPNKYRLSWKCILEPSYIDDTEIRILMQNGEDPPDEFLYFQERAVLLHSRKNEITGFHTLINFVKSEYVFRMQFRSCNRVAGVARINTGIMRLEEL